MVETMAILAPTGWYVSVPKIVFMLVLLTPWMLMAPWVHRDAKFVRSLPQLWGGLVVAAGFLGIAVWFLLPFYIVGVLAYIIFTTAAVLVYVAYRNGRVDPDRRVLTAAHISGLFRKDRKQKAVKTITKLKLYAFDSKIILPPDKAGGTKTDCEAYNLVQELLYDILFRRASEADMAPSGEETKIRYVIDGILNEGQSMPLTDSEKIVDYLKKIGGMNVEEHRRPQKGKMSVDLANHPVEIDLLTAGTTSGQRIQFRVLQEVVQTNLDLLGISNDVLLKLREMNKEGKGLIIVASKPKNGATSTMYALLREHDPYTMHLTTLETKPPVEMDNINQNIYGEPDKLVSALSAALRRDPDVVMVDQCPDSQTAQIVAEAAVRKTVILGLHGPDTFTALAKWLKVCGNMQTAVAPLKAIVCQTLIRKLCPNCRETYKPDPQLLAKINLSADKIGNFYRPPTNTLRDEKGRQVVCSTCQGTGYYGRTATFEMMVVTPEVKQVILGGGSVQQIKAACRKNKMLYLQEQALQKVIEGITSIQEVIRVTQQK
ncbi:MAG: Flp pilus assembly complex ATPase component TadA [Planctomycetes bacterium]|nr:Flp pilus assembly complex ATPase component TadA [Planctomycetota bacterium]